MCSSGWCEVGACRRSRVKGMDGLADWQMGRMGGRCICIQTELELDSIAAASPRAGGGGCRWRRRAGGPQSWPGGRIRAVQPVGPGGLGTRSHGWWTTGDQTQHERVEAAPGLRDSGHGWDVAHSLGLTVVYSECTSRLPSIYYSAAFRPCVLSPSLPSPSSLVLLPPLLSSQWTQQDRSGIAEGDRCHSLAPGARWV